MTAPQDSPVESYLDELFDRLAGTGDAGRRMLSDAESHLAESAAAARERGLTELDAERDAVARFGSMDSIARRVPVSSDGLAAQLRRVLVGGWALAAVTALWYGLSGMLTWLLHWPWLQTTAWRRTVSAPGRRALRPQMSRASGRVSPWIWFRRVVPGFPMPSLRLVGPLRWWFCSCFERRRGSARLCGLRRVRQWRLVLRSLSPPSGRSCCSTAWLTWSTVPVTILGSPGWSRACWRSRWLVRH